MYHLIFVLENVRYTIFRKMFLSLSFFLVEAKRSEVESSRSEARRGGILDFYREAKRSDVEGTRGEAKRFRKMVPRFGLWYVHRNRDSDLIAVRIGRETEQISIVSQNHTS